MIDYQTIHLAVQQQQRSCTTVELLLPAPAGSTNSTQPKTVGLGFSPCTSAAAAAVVLSQSFCLWPGLLSSSHSSNVQSWGWAKLLVLCQWERTDTSAANKTRWEEHNKKTQTKTVVIVLSTVEKVKEKRKINVNSRCRHELLVAFFLQQFSLLRQKCVFAPYAGQTPSKSRKMQK